MPGQVTRSGGWSVIGELLVGGQLGVNLQGGPSERATFHTIQFNVRPSKPISGLPRQPFIHVNPFATVEFSTNGNSSTRKFSVYEGLCISGICDSFSVRVIDLTPQPHPANPDDRYTVTVLVTPGVRPYSTRPYLPTPITVAVAPGAPSVLVPTPINCGVRSARVHVVNDIGGPLLGALVSMLDFTDSVVGAFAPVISPGWEPLQPTTANLALNNNNAPGTGNLLFTIYYGIDG